MKDHADLFLFIPGGSSIRALQQYLQIFKSQKNMCYDYGNKEENMKHYGSENPPLYDESVIKNWTINSFLTTSDNDALAYPQNIKSFLDLIPEERRKAIITLKVFNFF